MSCLNCQKEKLLASEHLTVSERQGALKVAQCFLFCESCGNVMLKTDDGEIVSTGEIRDTSIINLAYKKLFAQPDYQRAIPSYYGFTKDGEKVSTAKLKVSTQEAIELEEPTLVESTKLTLVETVENKEAEETASYAHVDNSNVVGFFSRIKRFMKNLFVKAS